MKKILIIALSVFLLTACGDKKIDATSQEALKVSSKAIVDELSGEDKEEFVKAMSKVIFISALESKGDDAKLDEILNKKLNGKTATEVIKIAENEKTFN